MTNLITNLYVLLSTILLGVTPWGWDCVASAAYKAISFKVAAGAYKPIQAEIKAEALQWHLANVRQQQGRKELGLSPKLFSL